MARRAKAVPVTPALEARGVEAQAIPARRLPFDEEWRDAAVRRAAEMGVGQAELGRLTDIAQGTWSNVIGKEPKAWHCDYVERMSFFLEIDLPVAARMILIVDRARSEGGIDALKSLLTAFEVVGRRAVPR